MKKLLILLFSLLISFNSYGKWSKVSSAQGDIGVDNYIDVDTIKKNGKYIYFWKMINHPGMPNEGYKSNKSYIQVDCGVKRIKTLSIQFYKLPMVSGIPLTHTPSDPKWEYPSPNSISGDTMRVACTLAD